MPTLLQPRDVPDLCARLDDAPRVAVDTEFHAERRYLPKLYLVQLHLDDGTTWLVDPLNPGLLDGLAEPLARTTWIVHGGQQDMRILHDAFGALPEQVLDTQIAAGLVTEGFPQPFGRLVADWCGTVLPKLATLSDWSRRPLTRSQLDYAAADARFLLPLWDRLDAESDGLGRARLVREACAEARARITDPAAEDTLWRELPASRALSRQEAAILQELVAWREAKARALDQPPRYMLNDGLLVDLARRQPLTLDSLGANRRLAKAVVKSWGGELLERIARAAARPAWAWPAPVSELSREGRVARWILLWALARGHAQRWAQGLALPESLAEDLAITTPPSREALAATLGTWRDALMGDALWAALRGQHPLVLDEDVRLGAPDPHAP